MTVISKSVSRQIIFFSNASFILSVESYPIAFVPDELCSKLTAVLNVNVEIIEQKNIRHMSTTLQKLVPSSKLNKVAPAEHFQ